MSQRRLPVLGAALVAAGLILMVLGAAFGPGPGQAAPLGFGPGGMMGGWWTRTDPGSAPGPGSPGFVAGTTATPRVVRIIASGGLRFIPDVVSVKEGETITFSVTTVGMSVHEFMVGPAADVADHAAGAPEIADIGMMQTESLTYTFSGPGPFAFACHAPGHYEAGMMGMILVVP